MLWLRHCAAGPTLHWPGSPHSAGAERAWRAAGLPQLLAQELTERLAEAVATELREVLPLELAEALPVALPVAQPEPLPLLVAEPVMLAVEHWEPRPVGEVLGLTLP